MSDKEVQPSTNGYGIPDAEYDEARRQARALVRGEPADSPTANKPEEQQTPTAEATSADGQQPASTETPEDPLTFVPEEHRGKIASKLQELEAQVRASQKKYDSDIGRINAYQSKYEEARREKAQLEAELAALKKAPPKPLRDLSERFRERAEVDDTLVEDMEELRSRMREELLQEMKEEVQQRLAPLEERQQLEVQRQQERAVEEFNRTLDEQVSNWREIVYAVDDKGNIQVNDKGQPVFSEQWSHFLRDQPQNLRNAYMNVSDANEALRAIEDHIAWGTKRGFFNAEEGEESTPSNAVLPNADKIKEKRQNDLKKAPPNKSANVPLQVKEMEDPNDQSVIDRWRRQAREAIKKGDPSLYRPR